MLVGPTKTLNRDVAPIGDDKEPSGESRADVEMGNDEDEEPLDAEIARVRMNPQNPTNRDRNKNMRIQDMLFTGNGVRLVLKVEELVDNIELNFWRKRKEKERLRLLLLITVSRHKKPQTRFQF